MPQKSVICNKTLKLDKRADKNPSKIGPSNDLRVNLQIQNAFFKQVRPESKPFIRTKISDLRCKIKVWFALYQQDNPTSSWFPLRSRLVEAHFFAFSVMLGPVQTPYFTWAESNSLNKSMWSTASESIQNDRSNSDRLSNFSRLGFDPDAVLHMSRIKCRNYYNFAIFFSHNNNNNNNSFYFSTMVIKALLLMGSCI